MTYLCSIYTAIWLTACREDLSYCSWTIVCLRLTRANTHTHTQTHAHLITTLKFKKLKSGKSVTTEDKTNKKLLLVLCMCVLSVCEHLAAYTGNVSVSWCISAEVMLDRMNVRTMYWDQHGEIWLRGTETLVSAQLSDSHPHQKPGRTKTSITQGLKQTVLVFILLLLIHLLLHFLPFGLEKSRL